MRKEFKCKYCSKKYYRDHSVKNTNFCSRKCYSDNSSIGMIGKKFNSWEIIGKSGKGKYICKCKCGFIKNNLTKHDLELNKTTCCINCRNEIPNIINKKFNNFTVIEYLGIEKTLKTFLCRCNKCGRKKQINLHKLTHTQMICLSCRARSKYYEEISSTHWSSIKASCKRGKTRVIEFNITIEYAWKLFIQQDKKCALSDIDIFFEKDGMTTASLDRIDSSKGYVEGNVQWVHKDVNIMKHHYDQNYFIKICKKIANKYNKE